MNWFIAAPTPGRGNGSNPNDANGDGLPDSWQLLFWSSINDPQAAPGADPDADGFNNLQEFLAGTVPTSGTSFLQIDSVQVSGANRTIHFTAVAGKTYTILYKDKLDDTFWQPLANVPAQGSTGPITISDSSSASNTRFYRLITPQLP